MSRDFLFHREKKKKNLQIPLKNSLLVAKNIAQTPTPSEMWIALAAPRHSSASASLPSKTADSDAVGQNVEMAFPGKRARLEGCENEEGNECP